MSDISIIGAGAFGTALAISLAEAGNTVSLIARTSAHARAMRASRENEARLPGFALPDTVSVSDDSGALAPVVLFAVPSQALSGVVAHLRNRLENRSLVACCKGVDLATGLGPTGIISRACPEARPAILSGPGFAADIAAGLPTAMTLACKDENQAKTLQTALSSENLRLYRSGDVVGVELGGALKNVIAIAAGITIGAGLGESARAALITRGYAEMARFSSSFGAREETLAGLSGLGDLVLTCTSRKSRNFRFGLALGAKRAVNDSETVEGAATVRAVVVMARENGLEMPISEAVLGLVSGRKNISQTVSTLLARPLKKE